MKPLIFVAVPLADDLIGRISARCDVRAFRGAARVSPDELIHGIADVVGVLASPQIPFPADVIRAAPHLRAIANIGVGYDNVDLRAASLRRIAVANTPGVLSDAVADCVLGMIIVILRKLPVCADIVRAGTWGNPDVQLPLGTDLKDKTLALIGYGRIGQEVAARAVAFKMRVLYYDPRLDGAPSVVERANTLDEALAQGDIVSLHVDLNESTRGFFGADQFAAMKPGAYFINAARGAVVDQPALCAALASGKLAGAALDVLAEEPPLPGDPILQCDNVFILPHIASGTTETRRAMAELAVDNLIACVHGEPCSYIVNATDLNTRA